MFFFVLLIGAFLLITLIALGYYIYTGFVRNYPKFCKLPGPYKYIGVSYHRIPNNIRFKLYYPSSKYLIESNKSQSSFYFKDGNTAAKGMHHFISYKLKVPLFYFKSLSSNNLKKQNKKHPVPAYVNAPILDIENDKNKKYPLIIYSHGMGGSFDVYTQISCNLASYGLIIAVIEHNDGSASHSKSSFGYDLFYVYQHVLNKNGVYDKPVLDNWKREHTVNFRGEQTDKRVENIVDLFDYLLDNDQYNQSIKPKIDFNNTFIAGHSFGGISTVLAAQYMLNKENMNKYSKYLRGIFVFEPWFEPKSDEILKTKWNLPYLCIIGDEWRNRKHLYKLLTIVHKSNKEKVNNNLIHCKGFRHNDFSDAVLFAPQWILKKINMCVQNQTIQQSQDLYCKICIGFIGNLIPKWKYTIADQYLEYSKTLTEKLQF